MTAAAPLITVTVAELRRAYLGTARRTGEVDVTAVGLTYRGRRIARLAFARFAVVDYLGTGGELLGRFQDCAELDD